MAKKQLYFNEAERLYVIEQCTIQEIANRLRVSEKTVRLWKEEGDWENKRLQYLKSKEFFHQ
ncbi:MAG: phage terminase small subunit-related protein, partial [Aquificaceae bacterium]